MDAVTDQRRHDHSYTLSSAHFQKAYHSSVHYARCLVDLQLVEDQCLNLLLKIDFMIACLYRFQCLYLGSLTRSCHQGVHLEPDRTVHRLMKSHLGFLEFSFVAFLFIHFVFEDFSYGRQIGYGTQCTNLEFGTLDMYYYL